MNIMIVAGGIPTPSTPLSGIFAFDQARALERRGNKVCFLAVDLRSLKHPRKWGISTFEKDGISCGVVSIPVGPIPLGLRCSLGGAALKVLYRKMDMAPKPDIIHGHFTEIGHMAAALAGELQVPVVLTEHSSAMRRRGTGRGMVRCAREAYGRADALVAVSGALARDIREKTGISCKIIHNIVDTEVFHCTQRTAGQGAGILTVGNLAAIKNHELLIEAFCAFQKRNPDSRLGIVGDGPLRDRLRGLAAESGAGEKITFYGRLDRDAIQGLFESYDVFAFSSRSETFGVACIEAMAAGLPVVSTRCGGPEDFITPENGILVPNGDAGALAEALDSVCSNLGNYPRESISRWARNHFSPDAISDSLMDLYRDIQRR